MESFISFFFFGSPSIEILINLLIDYLNRRYQGQMKYGWHCMIFDVCTIYALIQNRTQTSNTQCKKKSMRLMHADSFYILVLCLFITVCLHFNRRFASYAERCVVVVILATTMLAYASCTTYECLFVYTFDSIHVRRDWFTLIRFESRVKQVNKHYEIEVIDLYQRCEAQILKFSQILSSLLVHLYWMVWILCMVYCNTNLTKNWKQISVLE